MITRLILRGVDALHNSRAFQFLRLDAWKGFYVFLVLFFILLVIWLLGWLAFHVAGALIHILVILAIVSLIIHLVRGRAT